MEWKEIALEDGTWITQKMREDDRRGCEYSFCNNFIWRNVYKVLVTELCGCCIIKFDAGGEECFAFPIGGGDKRRAIELLIEEADGKKLCLDSLLTQDKELLEKWFPGQFSVSEERDGFDYLYTVEKLTSLAGKKLHGKRNHIARFKESNDWRYEPMTSENKTECLVMNRRWCDRQQCKWNRSMEDEFCAVQEAIEHFEELSLVGGVLYSGEEIVAFTIGEPLEGVNKIAKTIENKGFSRKGKADGKNFVRWKPLHILERCKEKRQGKTAVRHGLGIVFKL